MKHLRRKYRTTEEDKIHKITDSVRNLNLEKLSIFNKKKFENKAMEENEVEVIVDVQLKDKEKQLLKSPPKFAGLTMDEELSYAKSRMMILKKREEKLEDDEGIEEDREDGGNEQTSVNV